MNDGTRIADSSPRWTVAHRLHLVLSTFVLILATVQSVGATLNDSDAAFEMRIKAAFLFKFCTYAEWPVGTFESTSSPLVIGVVGSDALAAELVATVDGRMVGNHPLVVRTLRHGDALDGVHVIFVGAKEKEPNAYLALTDDRPVLTVTEEDQDAQVVSAINFVVVDHKVRFDIQLPTAERNGLRLSSRLLSVARNVRGGRS